MFLLQLSAKINSRGKKSLIHSHSLVLHSLLKPKGQDNPPGLASWRLLIPLPEEINSCILLGLPGGSETRRHRQYATEKKKKEKKKLIMEKVQRKACFYTAAEGKQELYEQQELLAPGSWSSEDHTSEASPAGDLVGWDGQLQRFVSRLSMAQQTEPQED